MFHAATINYYQQRHSMDSLFLSLTKVHDTNCRLFGRKKFVRFYADPNQRQMSFKHRNNTTSSFSFREISFQFIVEFTSPETIFTETDILLPLQIFTEIANIQDRH